MPAARATTPFWGSGNVGRRFVFWGEDDSSALHSFDDALRYDLTTTALPGVGPGQILSNPISCY